jgi:uncharacterized protein (DUF1800 family)
MELHTLGVDGGYTQRDVQELARVLTGHGVNLTATTPPPKLRPELQRSTCATASSSSTRTGTTSAPRPAGLTITQQRRWPRSTRRSMPGACTRHRALHLAQAGRVLLADEPPPRVVDAMAPPSSAATATSLRC